jgi:hypothetical protein
MAVKLTTAKQSVQENGLKILVHGLSGNGKTMLIESIVKAVGDPNKVCIISGEKGLLSLASGPAADCPVIEIGNLTDLDQAYAIVSGADGAGFEWVCLDSASDIAEVCLADEKAIKNDPRQAYGTTQDKVFMRIRKFRDLPGKNVYFIAKTKREKNESEGTNLYQPMMPGTNLSQGISYFFDEVFCLRVVAAEGGGTQRVLQTGRDLEYEAKDRSGKLAMFEPADLGHIHRKILGAAA